MSIQPPCPGGTIPPSLLEGTGTAPISRSESLPTQTLETGSWLEHPDRFPLEVPVDLDFKAFAQLCAPAHIKGTPFEGNSHEAGCALFSNFVKQTLARLPDGAEKGRLGAFREQLQRFQATLSQVRGVENREALRQLVEELAEELKRRGERWLPLQSFNQGGGAHAMWCRIDLRSRTLSIFNTGNEQM